MTYKAIVENMIKAKAVEKVETTLGENGYRFSEAEIKSIENNNTVGRKEQVMWIDTRDCVPLTDGEYSVQTVYGDVCVMSYTREGGWNTHYEDGKLITKNAIRDMYVARWFEIPQPKEVPEEWFNEYMADLRKGVNKCATE